MEGAREKGASARTPRARGGGGRRRAAANNRGGRNSNRQGKTKRQRDKDSRTASGGGGRERRRMDRAQHLGKRRAFRQAPRGPGDAHPLPPLLRPWRPGGHELQGGNVVQDLTHPFSFTRHPSSPFTLLHP